MGQSQICHSRSRTFVRRLYEQSRAQASHRWVAEFYCLDNARACTTVMNLAQALRPPVFKPLSTRRFRTQFFITFLPASPSSGFSTGTKHERLPTSGMRSLSPSSCFFTLTLPDGGQEIVSARFLHPSDALLEFRRKQITLMPPQYYILFTLSQLLSGRVNTQEQRDQVESLSRGAFGNMSINPKLLRNGRYNVVLTYEGDETRGGPPGRLHRALVKFEKGGVSVSMAFIQPNQLTPCLGMQRNRTSTELRHIQGL